MLYRTLSVPTIAGRSIVSQILMINPLLLGMYVDGKNASKYRIYIIKRPGHYISKKGCY